MHLFPALNRRLFRVLQGIGRCIALMGIVTVSFSCSFAAPTFAYSDENKSAGAFVIGVQSDITQRELDLLERTVDVLLLAQGDTAFTVRFYPKTALAAALESDEIDFVFTDPSVFSSLEGHFGLRAITSIFPQESSSPETVSAAALIVAEASPLRTLHDVSGKPIFVLEGFLSSLLKFDLQEQGYDTKSFFSNLKPSVATVEEAVSQVLAHPEGAALIPACWLEKNRLARGAENVRVIEPRRESRFSCERTTKAYPGWTFARTQETSIARAEEFQAILLSMPMTAKGMIWSLPPDFRALHHVLETTEDAFYAHVSTPGWKSVLQSYFPVVVTIIAVVLGLAVYGFLVSQLVSRRTRELLRARAQQEDAQRKFEALERVSIVGQMSSVVAHELRQPITAIGNYANSVMRRKKNQALTDEALTWALQRINAESERANAIIEHVRSYAKTKATAKSVINLSECITKALASTKARVRFSGVVKANIAPGIVAEVDALEMTLVVSNLYKNAAEACREGKDAGIEVKLFRTDDGIFLTFADNGKVLEAKDIDDLAVPLKTSKESGLGLGLSIVRRIVESHGGDVKFEALNPKGLCVTIHLPEIEGQSEYGKHEAAGIDSHRG